jgi:hypothetical protein
MTREERYAAVIEEVLDILLESGNGDLDDAIRLLFWAQDGYAHRKSPDGRWVTSWLPSDEP